MHATNPSETEPPEALRRFIATRGLADAPWVPLEGGRSNRTWRLGCHVVKLYERNDNPLFPNDARAERQALDWLHTRGIAPRLHSHGATDCGAVVVYVHVGGTGWREAPERVARLLDRLHQTAPPPGLRQRPGGSTFLAVETRRILSLCAEGPLRDRLLAAAPTGPEVPPATDSVFLHGDPVPGNLIDGPGGLALIDWQCPAQGDPVEDHAIFLSPAMQILYRGAPLSGAETKAYLTALADPAEAARYRRAAPWYHWRMAAYCLWRGADRYAGEARAMEAELTALACY